MLAYADEVAAAFGHVNQVYNNAGVAFAGDVLGSAFEDIERVVDIDFWGVVNGTKAFLPHLIASGDGHVVNISSLFGLLAVPGQSAYNAAKFAVRGFTESLRQEMLLAGHAVRVTCVHPGGIKTNIARNATRSAAYADGEGAGALRARGSADGPRRRRPRHPHRGRPQPRARARGRRRQSARPAGAPDGVGLPAGHGAFGAADVQLRISATTRRSCGLRR